MVVPAVRRVHPAAGGAPAAAGGAPPLALPRCDGRSALVEGLDGLSIVKPPYGVIAAYRSEHAAS